MTQRWKDTLTATVIVVLMCAGLGAGYGWVKAETGASRNCEEAGRPYYAFCVMNDIGNCAEKRAVLYDACVNEKWLDVRVTQR